MMSRRNHDQCSFSKAATYIARCILPSKKHLRACFINFAEDPPGLDQVSDASLQEASQNEREAASVITHLLGNLPLALDQAGAYILETRCVFAEYAALFHTHREYLLQPRIGKNIPTDHPDSITTTFELNFRQVQPQSSAAAHLLRMAAFLSPDAIPEELFTGSTSFLDPILAPVAADPLHFNHALEVLRAYSLIRRNPTNKTLSLHRLVQVVLQDMLEEEEQRYWAERVVLAANAAFPHAEYKTWPQCERLLTQAMIAAQWIKQYQFISEEAARLLDETASYLRDRARYREAEPLFQRALHIREQSLGLDHPETAESFHDLAIFQERQGNHQEALSLYQRALDIRERVLGPEHPKTGATYQRFTALRQVISKEVDAPSQDGPPPEQSEEST